MSNLKMPKIDNKVIQNRDQIIKDLGKFISKETWGELVHETM